MKNKNKIYVPKAIIFDWDNTLTDTTPIIHESLNKTFESMGREPWSFDDVKNGREGIHHSLRESFPRLFGDRWKEAREHYYKYFLECHLQKMKIMPGANEIVETLSETGIYLAVVSNKTGKYLRLEVEHLGWTRYFDKIIGATDAKFDKPAPDPVYAAMEGSGINLNASGKNDVWFIGDSETDIECALNANCRAVYFGDKKFPDRFLLDPRLDYEIAHFKDHQELLGAIKKFFQLQNEAL